MGLSGGSWQSALPLGMAAGEKEWKTPQLHCHHLRVGWLWPQENRTRAVHPCTQTDHLQHPCNTMRMPLPGLVAFGAEHCSLTKFPVPSPCCSQVLLQKRAKRCTLVPSRHSCLCLPIQFQCLPSHDCRSKLSVIRSSDLLQKVLESRSLHRTLKD